MVVVACSGRAKVNVIEVNKKSVSGTKDFGAIHFSVNSYKSSFAAEILK